jgi:BASS family bile acid:Na+ symporter
MTAVVLLVVKPSVVTLILAIGMGSTPGDLTYLWRRPRLLLRSVLAMYVVVPALVAMIGRTGRMAGIRN